MAERHALASTGAWAGTGDLVVNLGAAHPSGHGMLRLRLAFDGARITAA